MSQRPPPVPPANRSSKGPGSAPTPDTDTEHKHEDRHENLKEQGQSANIRQNTSNQGYQQDR